MYSAVINKNQVMNQVLKLAQNGISFVKTNPLVGCIITDKNGNILGKGYHQKYGENHAEINAIADAYKKGYSLKNAILYVNLEPCSHFGKTPPCVNAIINSGIKKVVIGHKDPNQLVNGNGIEILKSHNIEVEIGILEEKCKELNKVFIMNKSKNRPFILIKAAVTIDGRIADFEGHSKWITSDKSRNYVHRLRHKSDAILTTARTILQDNPFLNGRIGTKTYKKTIIVIDKNLEILQNKQLNIFNTSDRIIFLHNSNIDFENVENISCIKCKIDNYGNLIISQALFLIYEKFLISSIITECGGKMISYLIENNLFDEMNIFIAPKISFSNEKPLFSFVDNIGIDNWRNLDLYETQILSSDILLCYKNYN